MCLVLIRGEAFRSLAVADVVADTASPPSLLAREVAVAADVAAAADGVVDVDEYDESQCELVEAIGNDEIDHRSVDFDLNDVTSSNPVVLAVQIAHRKVECASRAGRPKADKRKFAVQFDAAA